MGERTIEREIGAGEWQREKIGRETGVGDRERERKRKKRERERATEREK